MKKTKSGAPVCVFCNKSEGRMFNMFTPRFPPFGTACTECEESMPEGTEVPADDSAAGNEAAEMMDWANRKRKEK